MRDDTQKTTEFLATIKYPHTLLQKTRQLMEPGSIFEYHLETAQDNDNFCHHLNAFLGSALKIEADNETKTTKLCAALNIYLEELGQVREDFDQETYPPEQIPGRRKRELNSNHRQLRFAALHVFYNKIISETASADDSLFETIISSTLDKYKDITLQEALPLLSIARKFLNNEELKQQKISDILEKTACKAYDILALIDHGVLTSKHAIHGLQQSKSLSSKDKCELLKSFGNHNLIKNEDLEANIKQVIHALPEDKKLSSTDKCELLLDLAKNNFINKEESKETIKQIIGDLLLERESYTANKCELLRSFVGTLVNDEELGEIIKATIQNLPQNRTLSPEYKCMLLRMLSYDNFINDEELREITNYLFDGFF